MATFDFDFFYAEEQAEGSDTWLRENWPWLLITLAIAWLFLLPMPIVGAGGLAMGLAVVAWRTRPAATHA